jgi:hypothetical protein
VKISKRAKVVYYVISKETKVSNRSKLGLSLMISVIAWLAPNCWVSLSVYAQDLQIILFWRVVSLVGLAPIKLLDFSDL